MTTSVTIVDPESFSLDTGEIGLLDEALKGWQDVHAFPDEKVLGVKRVFKRVFGLAEGCVLAGSTVQDAIILQGSDDKLTFYAIVQSESPEGGWEAIKLQSEALISWASGTSFRLILFLLSESVHGISYTP
jgi:hypothetical protein